MLIQASHAVLGDLLPEVGRRPEPHDGIGKSLRVVSDHRVNLVRQIHGLRRDRSDDGWHAERHALVHFPFDTGPEPQRRDGDPRPVEDRLHVGDEAEDVNALRCKRADFRRGIGADYLEDDPLNALRTSGKISFAK